MLENERWHSYLGDKIEFVSENVAHHWKRKEEFKFGLEKVNTQNLQNPNLQFKPSIQPVKNFTLFFKTEFSDCQKKTFVYIYTDSSIIGNSSICYYRIYRFFDSKSS